MVRMHKRGVCASVSIKSIEPVNKVDPSRDVVKTKYENPCPEKCKNCIGVCRHSEPKAPFTHTLKFHAIHTFIVCLFVNYLIC